MKQVSIEKTIALIALFAALVAVLGLIPQITLPFGVPITAQSLGIMLCGVVLGGVRGTLAVLLFLLLVALGLPLLSGGRGGLGVFVSPTAGFLVGFPIAAFVTGLIFAYWRNVPMFLSAFAASIIGGVIVLYLFGITGLSIVLEKNWLEAAALVMVFIPGDIIKAVITGLLVTALYKARPHSVLTR